MESLQVPHPLELVHLDHLMIEKFEGGKDVHILVITDHFTEYAHVFSHNLTNCTAHCAESVTAVHCSLWST